MADNDLVPLDPGMPTLAPLSPAPDTWGRTDVDVLTPREIGEHQNEGQVQFFGSTIPGDEQAVAKVMTEIQAIISGDLMRLGHPQSSINAAITWFQNSARKTPVREPKRHSYNLHDQVGDLTAESWANAMARAGVTQEFISNCLWLLGELNKRLGGNTPAQGRAPSSDPTAQLTDAQYERLVKHNEQVKAQTINRLAAKYGDHSYQQVIALAQAQLERLPAADRKHFDCWTGDFPWTAMLSTFEAIDGLYAMAVGANSIDKSGSGIAQELAAYEAMLRVPSERAKYMKDPQMQARYRELIRMRDGG